MSSHFNYFNCHEGQIAPSVKTLQKPFEIIIIIKKKKKKRVVFTEHMGLRLVVRMTILNRVRVGLSRTY
jgi:molybdopterin-biosynthesis enzyme MoeA-like protein